MVVADGQVVLLVRVHVDVRELGACAVRLAPCERHLEQVDVSGVLTFAVVPAAVAAGLPKQAM